MSAGDVPLGMLRLFVGHGWRIYVWDGTTRPWECAVYDGW